jgi:PhnB protein
MQVQPYVHFNGRCEEALNFYREVLGGEIVSMMKFSDAPQKEMIPPGGENQVMHASMRVGDTELFASDGITDPAHKMSGFSLSIAVASPEEGQRVFKAMAQGGEVTMPFEPTFWTSGFGMLVDKFGVAWMVNVNH